MQRHAQWHLRLSPARGALLFPAFNAAVIAGSLAGPRVTGRIGTRGALLAGFAAVAAGAAGLLALPADGLPLATLMAAFFAMGAGCGVGTVASTSAGTARVPGDARGVAAGLLNSAGQLGAAFGLAAAVPLVAAAGGMGGYRLGYAIAVLVAVAGASAALTTRRRELLRPPLPAAPRSR